ncbi:regulator of G protein signaling domain protein [Blumeria hordei DH14]|uniref:Regulator of G protein signaling domain protein n=2 Tax=Blumeria hordei TaxID=2867405 RepID=N1JNZ2_BLUG1|nr:regulator of G protein signaling domain protein [Blumeria hordei DH14]
MKYLLAPRMHTFKPSKAVRHHFSSQSTPSPTSTPIISTRIKGDTNTGLAMAGNEASLRPRTLQIQTGFHCPPRPSLQDVLSNIAPSPWTLSAFMAYLSQNHCLETLEFTMDAARYEKQYHKMQAQTSHLSVYPSSSHDIAHTRKLWQRLLDAYIKPNAPREVNLPGEVRDHLVSLSNNTTSPDPKELVVAVRIIYELMEESVLVPFLNTVTPISTIDPHLDPWTSCESAVDMSGDSLPFKSQISSPLRTNSDSLSSWSATARSPLNGGVRASGRRSAFFWTSSASSSTEHLTDDETLTIPELVTPPHTPPTSHSSPVEKNSIAGSTSHHHLRHHSRHSYHHSQGEGGCSWKKMGAKLCWKKPRIVSPSNSTSVLLPEHWDDTS